MCRIFFLCLLLITSAALHAQINVNIEVKRRVYVRYEPILATVSITNLAGRDLMLEDGESQWFGFTIVHGDHQNLIPPRNPDYRLNPLELKAGETVKRTVNLNELYPMAEYGVHRIRGTIYSKELNKYFTSRTANIDISEGRTVWKQTVGVPDTMSRAGEMHEVSLLSAQRGPHQNLFCRITDPQTGSVMCMYRLGHLIDGTNFDAQFDAMN